jgi:hypothetical protein
MKRRIKFLGRRREFISLLGGVAAQVPQKSQRQCSDTQW